MLSLAGWRIIVKAKKSPLTTAAATYTVLNKNCRRVAISSPGSTYGDIRFDVNVAADGDSFPIPLNHHIVVDAGKADVVGLYNTSGGTLDVILLELE
jgi:hypothetical protein